jgi:hypothetical protein
MPPRLQPAPEPADPSHRALARRRVALAAGELTQVRSAALAWTKGMAGVLVALLGFGLVKGRSDVGTLAAPWAVVVGALLLVAVGTGLAAAWNLLRAGYGRPVKVRLSEITRDEHGSRLALDHAEARSAGTALVRGLWWGGGCVVLLVTAVGMTWYGPAKDGPQLLVTTPQGVQCGEVVAFGGGTVTLKNATGQVSVELSSASWVKGVEECPEAHRQ